MRSMKSVLAYWTSARHKTWTSLRQLVEDEAMNVDAREPVGLSLEVLSAGLPGNGKGVDTDGCLGMTALYASLTSGHEAGVATMLYLLDNGADVGAPGYVVSIRGARFWDSVLAVAAQSGSEELVRHLLQRGADPKQLRCVGGKLQGAEDLLPASLPSRAALLTLLKAEGPYTDLFAAARLGSLPDVQRALNHQRLSVDTKDMGGATALMRAAQHGQLHVVEYLLRRRAKVDEMNAFGYTALWFAAYNGHDRTVRVLMEAGADPTVARVAQRVERRKGLSQRQKEAVLGLLNEDVSGLQDAIARTVTWSSYLWVALVALLVVLVASERAAFVMLAGSDSADHVKAMGPRQIETCIRRWCRDVVADQWDGGGRSSAADLKDRCRACQREWTPVPHMRLGFTNVTVRGDGATILERATGEFSPGELAAIMGSSGDGKSTLINAVRGSTSGYRDVQGWVQVNGEQQMSVRAAGAKLRPLTGFVPQDDVYYDWLTVEENLLSQLYWRSSPLRHPSEKAHKLKLVLEDLGIAAIRHRRCRGRACSGGQKKRVSIAMELVGDPSILFLDEPTSGLDYVTSFNLVSMLKALTEERGVHVSAIVHQPAKRIFDLFDTLMLVKKGHIVYSGPAAQAVPLYRSFGYHHDPHTHSNPSEWLVEVLHGHVANGRLGGAMVDEDQIIFDWLSHLRDPAALQQLPATNETQAATPDGMCQVASEAASSNETWATCQQPSTLAGAGPSLTYNRKTGPALARPNATTSARGSRPQPTPPTQAQRSSSWLYLSPWWWWSALKQRADDLRVQLGARWAQFGAVLYRECLINTRRGGKYTLTVPLMVGALAGVVRALIGRQYEELEGANFMLSLGSTLVSMVHSVSIFGLDGAMRKRELEAGMGASVYFLAKHTYALIPALLLPLALMLSYVATAGLVLGMQSKQSAQQWWGHRLYHLHSYFLLVLCSFTCQSVGFIVSFVLPGDISLAYLVVVGAVLWFHLNGSFTPRISQWAQLPGGGSSPRLLIYTSYVTFVLALLAITHPAMDDWRDPSGFISYTTKQRALLETFGYSARDYRKYLLTGLCGGAIAWRLVAYVVFMMTQALS